MFEELKHIELSGRSYPIKCDLLVLEKIQENYGSIGEFESKLMTWEPELDKDGNEITTEDGKTKYRGKFPETRAVNDALFWMTNEGESILAEKEARAPEHFSREHIVREVDIPLTELAGLLHEEFFRCFQSKNGKTTQRKEKSQK